MSTLAVINDVLVGLGAAGAVASVAVYGLASRWWINPIGRFLIAQGALIGLIYITTMVRLAGNDWLPLRPVTATSLIINVLAAALETGQAATFAWVIHVGRRSARRTRDENRSGGGGARD